MKTNPSRVFAVILTLAAFSSGWMLRASVAVEAMVEAVHKLNVVYKKLMAAIPSAAQKADFLDGALGEGNLSGVNGV